MKNLRNTFRTFLTIVLAISFTACEDDDLPKVTSGFTYTIDIDTGVVTFINLSNQATDYSWDFGDGTASTLNNPVKKYTNGTYTVRLTASHVSGSSSVFEDVIVILIPEIATIPISFDGESTKYEPEIFGGATFEIIDNPDPVAPNASISKVGALTNSGVAYEGLFFDLGAPMDLTVNKSVSMLFWSDKPIDILIKLEEGTGDPIEKSTSHGGTGWETIYFTFDSDASYSRFTMFVDGPGTTPGVFYFDQITQILSSDVPCQETNLIFPIDFDCEGIDYSSKIVGNVGFEVIDNPEPSGLNTDGGKVGKMVNAGVNWENAFFNLDTALDLSVNKGVKFKLFSEQALPIKLKLEDGTEAPVEVDVNHTGTGWELLSFTFSSSASYNDMVLFVDGPGMASGTFYIDDMEIFEGDVIEPCQVDATQSLNTSDFNLTFMMDPTISIINDGATFEWVDNPDFDNAINTSCKVGKITKLGQNPWDNNQINLDAKLDFINNTGFKIKVWSPKANTEVRIKLEEIGVPANNAEKFATTTLTNAWEELSIPFTSGDSDKFNKIVLFLDLNANNTEIYYIDDLKLYGTGSMTGNGNSGSNLLTNGDFEAGGTGWTGNALNPINEGGNTFNFANVMAAGAPSDVNLSQLLPITQGMNYTLTFDASSDTNRTLLAGIGLNEAPWTAATETVNLSTGTQTYTLNLSATDFGIANSRVLFDMGADTGVVVIDNVSLVLNESGNVGNQGGNLAANSDFELGVDTGWSLFPNNGTAVLDNTMNNGGSWSGKLETIGASNPAFKQERIGSGSVSAGNTVTVSFDHIGSTAGDGAVFNVLLFGEGAAGASFTHVFNPAPVLTSGWTSFTGTYTIPDGTDVSEGISFLIEAVCGAVNGCSVSANIDNISVTVN